MHTISLAFEYKYGPLRAANGKVKEELEVVLTCDNPSLSIILARERALNCDSCVIPQLVGPQNERFN